ncbi:uncharacterized protein LOC116338189 [Contarinia nasturtii]|uniref:uncharacterized protein LOC116338189 n=1 Tax=Contarinia nasturtii TaxID=265458 RepID=UPI0012D38F28|nr:uncharacterized protein LOC116338189 [Contarinia nasturtii]
MFDVIATAKKTQWLSFPTLSSKYTHPHVGDETVDFQVIPGKNCFVEFNKKFGFELLRTINSDGKEQIQRIKKRRVDDISCGAIAKVNGEEIALGMTTGIIRFFHVRSGEYMPIKFQPDRLGNSVVGLDYSNTNEYLAAVYDSADINLFALKTGMKTDTFKFSGNSTLVRFHPVRKFALAVGAYDGSITMLDIQTKKKLFFEEAAHDAPIRDISMYDSSQDLFVTCGFDCSINVFDLRRSLKVQQYKQPHPMSTICVSSCGTFLVAGNLKGDVISYDFRSMKEPLDTKRVHDSAIVRVAFIPSVTTGVASNTFVESIGSSLETTNATSRPSSGCSPMSAFDVSPYNNIIETPVAATPASRRDSWSDLLATKKIHDFSMDSVAETPTRLSILGDTRFESSSDQQSRLSMDMTVSRDQSIPMKVSEMKENQSGKMEKPVIESKRRRLTHTTVALEEIEEEEEALPRTESRSNNQSDANPKKWLHTVDHKQFADTFAAYVQRIYHGKGAESQIGFGEEDKENRPDNHQSSPNPADTVVEPLTVTQIPSCNNSNEITIDSQMLSEMLRDKLRILELEFENQIRNWQKNVMDSVQTKMRELTTDVRYIQGRYFQSDFNHRFRNHCEIEDQLALYEEGIAAMLHRDTVDDQWPIYAKESENLLRRYHEQQQLNPK